jgi:hypothetical protein
MARKQIDRSKVPPEMLAKAREAALAKQARMMAEAELGISDDNLPVQKGPLVDEGERIPVFINLAPFADRLRIDDVIYVHGRTYDLPERRAAVVQEAMSRGWKHQAEIEGKDHEFYLRQQRMNTAMSANTGQRIALK